MIRILLEGMALLLWLCFVAILIGICELVYRVFKAERAKHTTQIKDLSPYQQLVTVLDEALEEMNQQSEILAKIIDIHQPTGKLSPDVCVTCPSSINYPCPTIRAITEV